MLNDSLNHYDITLKGKNKLWVIKNN
jgi:hypothetical protein